ncbi:hypothetical protein FTUN_0315 [Frigoriglobus tundricola]|uniref:Uncharacterized protein n=1 Tax=Frigoriglobus tundricola TaxID=2774151 RepID=A0A6M5YFQ0_9BACT|nr:hypothetical protein FTUN_0315 [Frigoriglobus tundricola]
MDRNEAGRGLLRGPLTLSFAVGVYFFTWDAEGSRHRRPRRGRRIQ